MFSFQRKCISKIKLKRIKNIISSIEYACYFMEETPQEHHMELLKLSRDLTTLCKNNNIGILEDLE